MKFRILTILVLSISVVKCDKKEDFDKNRIQKRSYYHHPGSFNDVHYHTPGAVPFAANPFLFKGHQDPAFIKPFGIGPSHILPAVAPAPAPVFPTTKFVPGDAWVTQHSVTYPRYPVLQAPVVPTAPFVPTHPIGPPVFHAPALKPFAFAPPPVSYVPIPKPVVIPRPVVAQAFVPTQVAVKPIVPIFPPHHVAVQPTVSSQNPENPPINIPEEQRPTMHEIDETESPTTSDQSTHTHNTFPLLPAGLPPTFVMQIGTSSSGIDTSSFAQSPAQPSFNPAQFQPSSPPREPFSPVAFAPRPPSNSFDGMVSQMMPVFMQMMPANHHHHYPEEQESSFNFHPHSASVASSYGPPPQSYGTPSNIQQLRNHHRTPTKLRQRPNIRQRKPHRHSKKLKYTIIKHHHDKK